jgi:hypothetical protein
MLFSALTSCCSCFTPEVQEISQDSDKSLDTSSCHEDLQGSISPSISFASTESVFGSTSSISNVPRAVIMPYVRSTTMSARRSAIKSSTNRPPTPKIVHWSASSLVEEDSVDELSANIHNKRRARRREQEKEEREWHRGKSPLTSRVQVKRPPPRVQRKRSSLTLRSPLSPTFFTRKTRSREIIYPVVERSRRTVSVVDVYRYKTALLAETQQMSKRPLSPTNRRKKYKRQKHPPISPSKTIANGMKQSPLAIRSDTAGAAFTVHIRQQKSSSSEEEETLRDEVEAIRHHHRRHRRKPVDYSLQDEHFIALPARLDEVVHKKHKRHRETLNGDSRFRSTRPTLPDLSYRDLPL